MPIQAAQMPSPEPPVVSVIVPPLDEADNIDPLLTRLVDTLSASGPGFEILIADGGSKDETRAKTEAWTQRAPVRFVAANSGQGISGDVLVAVRECAGEVVVVMDADLSHPVEKVPELLRPVLDGSHDMAVGGRYIPGGETPDWPWTRRGDIAGRWVVRLAVRQHQRSHVGLLRGAPRVAAPRGPGSGRIQDRSGGDARPQS